MNIGIDIVHISRIDKLYERYGHKFLTKFMTDQEIKKSLEYIDVSRYAAKCWAVKEAAIKASNIPDMKKFIYAKDNGAPVLHTPISGKWTLSLSDEKDIVVAVVIKI